MTNFEKLRQDKIELAHLLNSLDTECELCKYKEVITGCKDDCVSMYLKWLNMEVEDD